MGLRTLNGPRELFRELPRFVPPLVMLSLSLCVPSVFAQAQSAAGTALRFFGNGANDIDRVKVRIDSPERPADVGGDFTIEFWMRATAADNAAGNCSTGNDNWIYGNVIVDRDVYGAGDHGDFGVSLRGGRVAFGVSRGSTGNGICGSRNVLDNAWHHIALTRNGTTGQLQIFVDGVLDGQGAGPVGDVSYRNGRSGFPNDPFLVLGAEKHDAGSSFPSYNGLLDELRISRTVRYTSNFSRPTAPFAADGDTVALYHFDENGGDTVSDSSGATGGPSLGVRRYGGSPAGPLWVSSDAPLSGGQTVPSPPTNLRIIEY